MNRKKGILIDIGIEFAIAIILMFGIYYGYELFHFPRIVTALFLLLCIPFFWGNIIFSVMGKNTIGQKIANRKKENRN